MKIGIAHFTDAHFSIKTNLDNKIGSCIKVLTHDFNNLEAIYIVISGDVVFSGTDSEFEIAKSFFDKLKLFLEKQYNSIRVKFIIVPGNHDCYLPDPEPQIRKNSVQNLSYESLGDDDSVQQICLMAQKSFWDFYTYYNHLPDDKLFYNITDIIGDKQISFHCINTSWCSQRKEQPGKLFFPVKKYDNYNNAGSYLNIGVWHHPYNWFNPSTKENNKKEFQHFTERLASVHFLGHEHENEFLTVKNQNSGDKINLISGKVFNQDDKPNNSGFATVVIDLNDRKGKIKIYDWNKEIFDAKGEKFVSFFKDAHQKFESNPDFIKGLDELKIPLVVGDKRKVNLSEIFVFPDLDAMNSDHEVLEEYQNSENIISNKYKNCVIAGDDQIGKSSLLKIIYLRKLNEGVFPILLNGSDIKEITFEKYLKRAFRKQYLKGDDNFEAYRQLDRSRKILLIDDLHNCKVGTSSLYSALKEFLKEFELAIFTIDSTNSLLPLFQTEFNDLNFYKVKPLGYYKRNELILRYNKLKKSNYSYLEDISDVNETFDKVGGVLGEKLIPSYPIFVISILQALDYTSIGQNETSFGYCYQTLIYLSLLKADVKNDNIDTYYTFLTALAYEFIKEEKDFLTEEKLLDFMANYKRKFVTPSISAMVETLKESNILIFEDDMISFGYEYILYYLSAKRISEILLTKEGKDIVIKLYRELENERNGNILVFITHHTKDYSFIEESVLNSMVILPDFTPITLSLDDPFYTEIKGIATDVSKEVLEIHKNPTDERNNRLKRMDQEAKERAKINNEIEASDTLNEMVLPFKQALRSIEIIGQIIRNRKGSLEIDQLKEMIKEIYTTGFRTISYNGAILRATKSSIIAMVNEHEHDHFIKAEIEEFVTNYVMMSSVDMCLGIFTKIMRSLGVKDLKNLFLEVAQEINTPAAKLVSFSIVSYYGNVSEKELKNIYNDLKNNPVALKLLRARVQSYVYNRDIDIRTKQKFATLLGMRTQPSRRNVKVDEGIL